MIEYPPSAGEAVVAGASASGESAPLVLSKKRKRETPQRTDETPLQSKMFLMALLVLKV